MNSPANRCLGDIGAALVTTALACLCPFEVALSFDPGADHYYRFETGSGFTSNSAGAGQLEIEGTVTQVLLPASGRGSSFPQGFDLDGADLNLAAADLDATGMLVMAWSVGSISDFQAFLHMDSLTGCARIVEIFGTSDWSLRVCDEASAPEGIQPGELFFLHMGLRAASGIILQAGVDYFIAVSREGFRPDPRRSLCTGWPYWVHANFWVRDLTAGTAQQHTGLTLDVGNNCPEIGQLEIGNMFDGLIDEVRISRDLTEDQLLTAFTNDDADSDGLANRADNCAMHENPQQRDTNGDNIGNACDADLNNDCSVNFEDLGLLKAAFFTADSNADFNGDGSVNFVDLGIMKEGFFGVPGPSGLANACDSGG